MFKKCCKYSAYGLGILILVLYVLTAGGLWVAELLVSRSKDSPEAFEVRSTEANSMLLLDSGALSLQRRLEMIESAQHTLELEFFIFNVDESSRLVTQALVRKAEQGVKVRLLVDFSAPVFQLKPAYAKVLKSHGVDVRYYNTSSVLRVVTSQHRSHRKLLIADGQSVITGGRNIANEYFDLGEDYNFHDSDVEIRGPIVEAIRKSFDLYWTSNLSVEPDQTDETAVMKETDKVGKFLKSEPGDDKILQRTRDLAAVASKLVQTRTCHDLTFVTDFPNQGEKNRLVYPALVKALSEAKSSVKGESPYFVLKSEGLKDLQKIGESGVDVQILTNSLYSTDAFYSASALYLSLRRLSGSRLTLYGFTGNGVPGEAPEKMKDERWGLHSKRAVLDESTVLIGTYNIDPRSANLNSEILLVCRNAPDLARDMLKSWQRHKELSSTLIENGKILPGQRLLHGASLKQKIAFILALPLANLFDFLL